MNIIVTMFGYNSPEIILEKIKQKWQKKSEPYSFHIVFIQKWIW